MKIFTLSPEDITALLTILAGAAILTALVVVLRPYLVKDHRGAHLRRFREAREQVRVRERASLAAGGLSGIAERSKRRIMEILLRLVGIRQTQGDVRFSAFKQMLRQAGFRNRNAVLIYVAFQVLTPTAALAGAAAYMFLLAEEKPDVPMQAIILFGALASGYFLPRIYVKNRLDKRRSLILTYWPDALDLMLICIESGMSIEVAFAKVADELAAQSPELADELNLTVAELSYLQDRSQAFRNLGERTGLHSIRAVVSSLMQCDKYGTSIAGSLRVISQEQRDARMLAAEKKAASLPPKLTVPMILFFLPVLFVVILMPAAIKIMEMQ